VSHRAGRDEGLSEHGKRGTQTERGGEKRHCHPQQRVPEGREQRAECLMRSPGEAPKDAKGPQRPQPCTEFKQAIEPYGRHRRCRAPAAPSPRPRSSTPGQ